MDLQTCQIKKAGTGEFILGNIGGFSPQGRILPGSNIQGKIFGSISEARNKLYINDLQLEKDRKITGYGKEEEIAFPFRKRVRKRIKKPKLSTEDLKLAESIIGISKQEIEPDSSKRFREYLYKV